MEETEAIEQFYRDFRRTTEIVLKVAGEGRVHYIQEKDIDLAEEKSAQFIKAMEIINPSLKTAMVTKLHQSGAFYSGGFATQAFILLARALVKQDSKHKFVVEVMNEHRVIIKEIMEYTALKLISLEDVRQAFFAETGLAFRELTKREENVLEQQRQICLAALSQNSEFSEMEPLILSEPLIATVQYELQYCPQQNSYQFTKLSADNISIPSIPIEKLLFATDRCTQEKLNLFFEKLIEIIKAVIVAITSQFSHNEENLSKSDNFMVQPRF